MLTHGSWPPDLPGQPGIPGRPPPEIPWPVRPPGPSIPPTVPLVPFPATTDSPSNEVRDRLLDQRRVMVGGFLDDALATRASAELMWLDGRGDEPVDIHFSAGDGDLNAAHALADTIDLMGVPIRAWCRGSVGGPALAPFTAADQRLASPFAVFHLRNPSVQSSGPAADLESFARHHQRQVDALHRRIADATGQTTERVVADFTSGTVLDAEEARRYGIVHEISPAPPRPVTRIDRSGG